MSPRGDFPTVRPSLDDLSRETRGIRRVLARCGVPASEQPDLIQEVLIAAWTKIAAGDYRPNPALDPTLALRGWLHRIAFYKANRYRHSARVRYERLAGLDAAEFIPEPAIDPRACLEAREALAMTRHVGPAMKATLLEVASGKSFEEVGEELGKPAAVVLQWFERGKELLGVISEQETVSAPPSPPPYVTVKVEPAVLMAEMRGVRPVIRGCGVPVRDLEDIEQTVLLAAWCAVKDGRFRMLPDAELGPAVGRWLYGIAWRQATHHTRAAYHRRELPSGLAMDCTCEEEGAASMGQLEAREILRLAVSLLAAEIREVIELVAVGMTRDEIAGMLGLPAGTVASYIRRARALLVGALDGDGGESGGGEEEAR